MSRDSNYLDLINARLALVEYVLAEGIAQAARSGPDAEKRLQDWEERIRSMPRKAPPDVVPEEAASEAIVHFLALVRSIK